MIDLITLVIFVVVFTATALLFMIEYPGEQERRRNEELTGRIDGLLPQTQCGECGYAGCRPYAEAIVAGAADIDQCQPGGAGTVRHLAELLGQTPPLSSPEPADNVQPVVACIDEQACIGCVKCITACPVDAIIGAAKQLHTVMPKVCTGCGLCVPPCPVDCISLLPAQPRIKRFVWTKPQPAVSDNL